MAMMDEEWVTNIIKTRKWALIYIEYRVLPNHQCIRKCYIRADDGVTDIEYEFYPCIRLKDLEKKYKRLFYLCHKTSYDPKQLSPECVKSLAKINGFIKTNKIEVVLFRGYTDVLRRLYDQLCVPCYSIDVFKELDNFKAQDPRWEVNNYFEQLLEFVE